MGRLKRYKKLKSCDPCAKKKVNEEEESRYDLPPGKDDEEDLVTTSDDLIKKVNRKRLRVWEEDALRNTEYLEDLFAKSSKGKKQQQDKPQILPRQPHESMRAFQYRVSQETKQLLQEHAKATSSTQARRKAFLKEKKKLKKLKKKGGVEAVEEYKYGQDGYRDQEYFKPAERINFGETNPAPPDLRKLGAQIAKRAKSGAKAPLKRPVQPQEDPEVRRKRIEKAKLEAQAAYRELKKRRMG